MRQFDTVAALDAALGACRGRERVAFVPTMGNLHQGHLALVRRARELAERVVVSVFVNPLQFGAGEDFDAYPRTLQRDAELIDAEGVDWLFTPSVGEMYPRPPAEQTRVLVPGLGDILCGASRPGHFEGVATVVCKLFNMVRPDIAVFGQKDYQQLLVIRRMVADLAMPIDIVGMPTVREANGLAMSSRNGYLSDAEREQAAIIYRTLSDIAAGLRAGRAAAELVAGGIADFEAAGLRTDYLTVRRQADLAEPDAEDTQLVVLAAAFLGKTRLIDNLEASLAD